MAGKYLPSSSVKKTLKKPSVVKLATALTKAEETPIRGVLLEAIRSEVNVAQAIIHAETELKNDAQEPPEKTIDDDWLFRWRDYAGEVSSEQLQTLWGKLLAGELKSPGSYSLRSLDFIRNLSSEEANEIAKLSRFVIPDVIFRPARDLLDAEGVSFAFMLRMQDLGIVSGVEALGLEITWNSVESSKFVRALCSNGKALFVKRDDPKKIIKLQIYKLTEVGRQILRLGTFEPHDMYLRRVSETIKGQGFAISLTKYRIIPGNQIQIFDEEAL